MKRVIVKVNEVGMFDGFATIDGKCVVEELIEGSSIALNDEITLYSSLDRKLENPYVYKAKDLTIEEVYEDYEICLDCGAVMDDEGNCPRCDNEDKLDLCPYCGENVDDCYCDCDCDCDEDGSYEETKPINYKETYPEEWYALKKVFEKQIIKNYFLNNFEKSLKALNHPMAKSVLDRYEAIKQDLTPEILLKFFKENNIGASIDPLMLDMAEKMFS